MIDRALILKAKKQNFKQKFKNSYKIYKKILIYYF